MSEITLFNRWTVKKKVFWWSIGLGIPALCILSFLVVSLFLFPGFGGMSAAPAPDMYSYDGGGEFAMGAPAMDTADESFYMEEMAVEMEMARSDAMDFDSPAESVVAGNTAAVPNRLIIRDGNISVAVENTIESRDQIEDIVTELAADGAFVVSSSQSGAGVNRQPYINMVLRVPVESFDQVMDQIEAMGVRVDERFENAQDVTDEYVDVQGRIDALEISIERLQELMRDAEFTEDLLYAEEQLSRREAELESLKGRLNYLADSAALSRINVQLSPYELSQPIDTSWKPAETFRRAVENLLDSMRNFADFMIVFLINVAPWLIFFGLILWGVVAIVRRRRRKKANPEAQAE